MAQSVIEPALNKSNMGCLKDGYASMKPGLAVGASYVLRKCRFSHIYCNPRSNTATHISRRNQTVSHLKIGKIHQKP